MESVMHPRSRLKKRHVQVFKRPGIKQLKQHSWKTTLYKLVKNKKKIILSAIIALVIIIILIPPATYLYFANDFTSKKNVINTQETGLTLKDRNGEVFYTYDVAKTITYIPLSQIPTSVQDAAVSSEDKNFYTNPGFSITGIARAFLSDITAGRIVEGGSTITQELAKNAFLSPSQTLLRKYQELVLAYALNRRFSKQDILEMYLNSVYFGEGAFGIQNAAQTYFGTDANNLDLAQSALLIGVLPAPSLYSPLSNPPAAAYERQKIVLSEMVQNGYITQDQADTAENETLHFNTGSSAPSATLLAPHFALYIRDQLFKQYGEERVVRDGFTVTTTLDPDLQTYTQGALTAQVARLKNDDATNGAVVVLNPQNGQILAMVGSYDWYNTAFGQTNMAISPRQPGSSFKPVIYGRALEENLINPATILQDVKTTFNGGYTPHDYDYKYRGPVTVRRALSNSLNIPAVEVMQKVGVSQGLAEAQKFGIDTLDPKYNYGLSLVLGSGEIPLLEMTNAYAVFADQGIYHKTTGVISIKDKYGTTVLAPTNLFSFLNLIDPFHWFTPAAQNGNRVISQDAAYLVTSILSDNQARAEEFGDALTIPWPAAVKTGTTNDFRDALTLGYTPSIVVGVWIGNNDNKPMDNIAGSLGAAPIWRNVMEYYLEGKPVEQFTQPSDIISEYVCPYGPYTREYQEYFMPGTQPDSCDQPTPYPTFTPAPTQPKTPTPTNKPGPTAVPATPVQQLTATPTPIQQLPPTQAIPVPTIILPTPTP